GRGGWGGGARGAARGDRRPRRRRRGRGDQRPRTRRADRRVGELPDLRREPDPVGAGAVVIAGLIALCARNRVLTLIGVGAAFAWGLWALSRTPLDALPDLSDVQVIVSTEWPG